MPFAINGDVRLYYETLGNAADPAVLLLGGAGKQLIDFPDAFCDAIVARGFSVIRLDQRDTGLSTGFAERGSDAVGVAEAIADGRTPDLPYTTADLAADVVAVLDAVGIARAHLFGRSLGAYVAQAVALQSRERALSLTLVMTFSRAIGTSVPRARLEALDAERFADAAHFAERQVATARAIGNPAYFNEPAIRAAAIRAFDRGVPEGSIARHFMLGLAAPDLRGVLGRLSMPVQIIHGALDTIIPLTLAEETAAAIPQARLTVLDDMAHEGPPQLWDRWIDLLEANVRS
ncbi:alpha/beta hydrolase [Sphingomonas sp.]|jgi:pimeloyl-ACP methyl ester carboxylesterase|uniref:alpha/beta fold hydrolase n=1 Tax=Sphingomonas sp. TaxID=28214 RepID=UPI002EDBA044